MMFWRWKWNKKENISEPIFNVKLPTSFSFDEIIATTYRHRIWKYRNENLNIDPPDYTLQRVKEIFAVHFEGDTSNIIGNEIIDQLQDSFKQYEYQLRKGSFASIKEYGK